MTSTTLSPSAVEQLWFLDNLVTIRVPRTAGGDGISVIEFVAPFGDSPPLHVHHNEDEIFHVLDGELHLRVGDDDLIARAGDILCAPKGVPHTFRVTSESGARYTVTTARGGFEALVRTVGREADSATLPAPSGPPTDEQMAALVAACAASDITVLGPPL